MKPRGEDKVPLQQSAGGAEFLGARASYLLYAAAAPFGSNPPTRYLMLDPLSWANGAPFVDTDGHHPTGY